MPVAYIMNFPGAREDQFALAMSIALKHQHAKAGWPSAMIAHYSGPTEFGWCAVEVWEDDQSFRDYQQGRRLGEVFADLGMHQPQIESFPVRTTRDDIAIGEQDSRS